MVFFTRLIRFLVFIPFLLASAALAQERTVVVELYTSQGCSSCPPADALLGELAARDDVIALALHVDYWDYIGWKDTFADPAFTARQYAYAKAAGEQMVYTPQMILNGQERLVGSRSKDVTALLGHHKAEARKVNVTISRSGTRVTIDAKALQKLNTPLSVQLVQFTPQRRVNIRRGENRGKTIAYANIVTSWTEVTRWTPDQPLHLKTTAPQDTPLAVIVQQVGHGPILAAAQLR